MNSYLLVFSIFFSGIFLSGCSASPLFNHTEAPNPEDVQRRFEGAKDSSIDSRCNQPMNAKVACLDLNWTVAPSTTDSSALNVNVYGVTSEELNLEVELWMPEHGHGAPPVIIEKLGTSVFNVSDIYFIMPGHWEVRFRLYNGQTLLDVATLEVNL